MGDKLTAQLAHSAAMTRRDLIPYAPCTGGTDDANPAANAYGDMQMLMVEEFCGDFMPSQENRIINGDFLIDQYNEGASAAVQAGGSYLIDRWLSQSNNGAPAQQRVDDAPSGFFRSLKFTVSGVGSAPAAGQTNYVVQRIEGINTSDFNWGAAGAWAAANYLAATGELALVATAAATFQITNVRLRAATFDAPYVARPFPAEIALCQRYFQKTFNPGTAPAQNAGSTGALKILAFAISNSLFVEWQFPVIMRSSPTVVTFNPGNVNASWRDGNGTDSPANVNSTSCRSAFITGNGENANDFCLIHATASAEL